MESKKYGRKIRENALLSTEKSEIPNIAKEKLTILGSEQESKKVKNAEELQQGRANLCQ